MTRRPPAPVHSSPFRTYRAAQRPDLLSYQLVIEETDLWIAAASDLSAPMADAVRELRGQIKTHAAIHPEFLTSLAPLEADQRAPDIIQRMCRTAEQLPRTDNQKEENDYNCCLSQFLRWLR